MNVLFDLTLTNETTNDVDNNNKKLLYEQITGSNKKFYNSEITGTTGNSITSIDTVINEIKKENKAYNTQLLILTNTNIQLPSITIPEYSKKTGTETNSQVFDRNINFYKFLNEVKLYNAIHLGILSELLYLKDIDKKEEYLSVYIPDTGSGSFFWNNGEIIPYKKFIFYY